MTSGARLQGAYAMVTGSHAMVRLRTWVVDVPVISPIDREMVPQIQFIVRLLDFQLCHREGYAQKTVHPAVQFLGEVVYAPVAARRPVPWSPFL